VRAFLLALALAPAAAGALDCPRGVLLVGDALVTRVPESPRVAVGGRLLASARCVALATRLDWAAGWTRAQPAFSRVGLVGAGATVDLAPRLSVHALALAGGYYVQVRDYVYGGWRDAGRSPGTFGGEVGVRWRALGDADGHRALPVGLGLTVLRVSRERDALRAVAWGGWVPLVTLSLGVELRPTR
jgi:hypothetical protein